MQGIKLLAIFFCSFILVICKESSYDAVLLKEIIVAINSGLNYLDENIDDIIVDGVVGVRMVDDQLQMLLESDKNINQDIYIDFYQQIFELQQKAESLADRAITTLLEAGVDVDEAIAKWMEKGRWKLDHENKVTDERLRDENSSYSDILKLPIDTCAIDILGLWGYPYCPCIMTDMCWSLMAFPHHTDYWLTHQILYLETAEMCGCNINIQKFILKYNQGSLREIYDIFCSNVMKEAEAIARKNYTEVLQDLFAEQILVCGMIGYRDFYRPEWLIEIISWQQSNGCFDVKGTDYDMLYELETGRYDKTLEGDCSIHKTAISIAALAVSIRLMAIEPKNI